MEIYIEFAIIDNLVIDYVLLYLTCISARIRARRISLFLGSMIGTILAIILPIFDLHKIISFALKLLIPVVMIFVTFKVKNARRFFVLYGLLLTYTFVMGGTAIGIILLLSGRMIDSINLRYDSILPVGIVILTIIVYSKVVVWLVNYITKRKTIQNFLYDIEFVHDGKPYKVTAYLDSGNFLTDTKTKLPIIIISKNSLNLVLKNARKIEYSTISCEKKQMEVFSPEGIRVFCHGDKREIDVTGAMIGLTNKSFKDYDALVPATIFL